MSNAPDSISCALCYTIDTGKRQSTVWKPQMQSGDAADEDTNVVARCTVTNARKVASPGVRLSTHGFELVPQRTSLTARDFDDPSGERIKRDYYPELAALICAYTGAAQCIPFHHMVRVADAKRLSAHTQAPAGAVHCDYTSKNSLNMYDTMCPKEIRGRGRFLVINAWRNISDTNPIVNDHLAMCDATSLVAPDDFVHFDVTQKNGTVSESYRLDCGHSHRHRWYYYPHMLKDECLLFVQYDSDTTRRVRYTFHTSIKDPTCPANAPFRESIELRCIAFFPNDPNTIPTNIIAGPAAVRAATIKVLALAGTLDTWDDGGKRWVRGLMYGAGGGSEHAIRTLVAETLQKQGRGEPMSPETVDDVVRRVVEVGEFDRVVRKLLPPLTGDAEKIADAVRRTVDHAAYIKSWDDAGKRWVRGQIHGNPDGVAKMARHFVVNNIKATSALSDAQCEVVIAQLIKEGELARVMLEQLPPPGPEQIVSEAVEAIIASVSPASVAKYWDDGGRKWGAHCVKRGILGFGELASNLVKGLSDRKEYGMAQASQDVRNRVAETLMADPRFMSSARAAFQ